MVLWTKLWYYYKNYGTIPRPMELRFQKEKNMIDYQKPRNLQKHIYKPVKAIYARHFTMNL